MSAFPPRAVFQCCIDLVVATDASIVLKACIFGELNCHEVASIISGMYSLSLLHLTSSVHCTAGSSTFVQPLIKIKEWDTLLTFPSVLKWCTVLPGGIN